jgi:U2 small nuclear ribonucleoprotein A'
LTPPCTQILAIKAAIANAKTLEEVTRLERALRTGMLPEELGGPKPAGADSMVE